MYSPKIKERFIPVLYRIAREKEIPIARLVNQIVADYLANHLAHKLSREGRNGKRQVKRWLRAIGIAKCLFEEEGYHISYLEEIENLIRSNGLHMKGGDLIDAEAIKDKSCQRLAGFGLEVQKGRENRSLQYTPRQ